MHLRDLLGQAVISDNTGNHLGRVAEVLLDIGETRLVGFRLRRGGLFDRRWRVAAIEDVLEIDTRGIHIARALALHEDERLENRIRLGRQGVSVFGESGARIGEVKDATAEPDTHLISALLVIPYRRWRARSQQPVTLPLAAFGTATHNRLVVKPGAAELLRRRERVYGGTSGD